MPEIAETALFAQDANNHIGNRKLKALSVHPGDKWAKTIVPEDAVEILTLSQNSGVEFSSAGKALICKLQHGHLVFRLGMTGRLIGEVPEGMEKHCFLTMVFEENRMVHYVDFRRFGRVIPQGRIPNGAVAGLRGGRYWRLTHEEILKRLSEFSPGPKAARHTFLLSSGVETGVGNYLACEALGALGLNPFEPFTSREECAAVLEECGAIAERSFEQGGNSFAGGYVRFNGQYGEFAQQCNFYQNPDVIRTVFRGRPVYSTFSLLTNRKASSKDCSPP